MEIIEDGICAVDNVMASGARKGKYGVAIILSKENKASAVFTSNKVVANPLTITKKAILDGKLSAIVANSGNANCFTGEEGMKDGMEMAKKVATYLNLELEDVAVASTGIIGRKFPIHIILPLINQALTNLENSPEASKSAAEAIMTTDTFLKEFAVKTRLKNGDVVKIGGIAKGSGMIAPNMGTMLCFLATDVKASTIQLENALRQAVRNSFNMVDVDGDESTNDMVILLTNESAGEMDENFQEALDYVCRELAKMMAKDGEGATKFMEIRINGALSDEDARSAAKSIAGSSLVKTALFGAEANWGRIIAAVGYSSAKIDERLISVSIASSDRGVEIVEKGFVKVYHDSDKIKIAEEIMANDEIMITVDLGLGNHSATAFGCDLSYDYVKINSEHST